MTRGENTRRRKHLSDNVIITIKACFRFEYSKTPRNAAPLGAVSV